MNCESLREAILPDTLTQIGSGAFQGCSSIKKLTFPENLNKIADSAFSECTSLTSVDIPDTVDLLGVSVFSGCTSLSKVTLPATLTSIPQGLLEGTAIKSIVIPEGVETIGDYAFAKCNNLESVYVPDSVTTIGDKAIGYIAGGGLLGFGWSINEKTTICGSEDSAAAKYAEENGVNFKTAEFVQGDVNMDGSVKIADAVMLQKYLLGNKIITESQWKLADMDGNGSVNGMDMALLRQALVKE